jgi:hypothetical protein
VTVWISNDTDIPPSVYEIDTFKGFSVATSQWTLYLPVETASGAKLIDLDIITDIEIHFYYYWYARPIFE